MRAAVVASSRRVPRWRRPGASRSRHSPALARDRPGARRQLRRARRRSTVGAGRPSGRPVSRPGGQPGRAGRSAPRRPRAGSPLDRCRRQSVHGFSVPSRPARGALRWSTRPRAGRPRSDRPTSVRHNQVHERRAEDAGPSRRQLRADGAARVDGSRPPVAAPRTQSPRRVLAGTERSAPASSTCTTRAPSPPGRPPSSRDDAWFDVFGGEHPTEGRACPCAPTPRGAATAPTPWPSRRHRSAYAPPVDGPVPSSAPAPKRR